MRTNDYWKTIKVYNSHNLVSKYIEETGKIGVYLAQSANDGTRMNMGVPTGYVVMRPGFYTAIHQSNKTFETFCQKGDTAERWSGALHSASAWTATRYNVGPEFVAIPGFGRDRFPKEIALWAKNKMREIKKVQAGK